MKRKQSSKVRSPRESASRSAERRQPDVASRAQCAATGVPPHLGFALTTHRSLLLLTLASLVLLSLIFEPIGWWPLAFVCLVPWCLLVGASASAPRVYFYSFLMGLLFFLINMRWVLNATGPSFAYGYVAFALYLAAYFPLMACPIRHAIRRRRMPLALIVPLVWTGGEMLRAVVISGFPWFFLGHSLHGVLSLIQISDLVGAYGVTFVVAAFNGMLADGLLAYLAARRAERPGANLRRARFSIAFGLSLLIISFFYGQVQLRRDTLTPGPRIATIQGDYLTTLGTDSVTERERKDSYFSMMAAAAAQDPPPDLYLLPEAPWAMYLNSEIRDFYALSAESFRDFRSFAQTQQAYVVVGAYTRVPTPDDLLAEERRYNSAYIFVPDGSEPRRYDKRHLVYFGETLPFRFGRLRFVYLWLNSITPFSGKDGTYEWSTFPGALFRVFDMEGRSLGGQICRFGVPICYEDVMPYVSREFTTGAGGQKRVEMLLNISHDGWFGRGHQQPQHLATCVFRAVENRVPVVRSVNTGISGFIESSGRTHDLVEGDPATPWPGNSGYAVSTVSLDSRHSLYSRAGDWFAWSCAGAWLLLYLDYLIVRARTREEEQDA